jgi:outer membrane biogenesis lipoprotein LolB
MNPVADCTNARTAGHSWAGRLFIFAGLSVVLLVLICCRPSGILLRPVPANIERLEGHASLRISGERGSARSKFTFLFQLPHQGRIEVSDFLLGRTLYQIIVDRERAVFLVPSKKVYWEGEEEEIIDYFLGFRLSLEEMISLIKGEWEQRTPEVGREEDRESWNLKRDEKGRVLAGTRENLHFEVKEFLSSSHIPRILIFQHQLNSGRLKMLRIDFNRPAKKKEAFSLSFLADYRRVSWEEIEKILADEN